MGLRQISFSVFLFGSLATLSNCSHPGPTREQRLVSLNQQITGASLLEQALNLDGSSVSFDDVRRQWDSARAGYRELQAQTPDDSDVKERLALVEKRLALLDAEHDYASKIEISTPEREANGRTRSFGQPAAGIFSEVKNRGEHTVVALELTFELLDAAGTPIGERSWTPVFEGSDEGPLKPNYSKPFGFAVENPPSGWVSARARVKRLRLSRQGVELPEEKK